MNPLNWEMQVLSRSTHYPNLSGAAQHVGLSQPQLSRIVKKLEDELGVVLLDRSARSKSSWTLEAHKISELFTKYETNLRHDLNLVLEEGIHQSLRVGTLEGLIPLSCDLGHFLTRDEKLTDLRISVYDLNQLEEHFYKGNCDLILTCREPGKQKFTHTMALGVQEFLEYKEGSGEIEVFSEYEFENRSRKASRSTRKAVVSNSLEVRKVWLSQYGGRGRLPHAFKRTTKLRYDLSDVILLGAENLSPSLWKIIQTWIPAAGS